jgi:hypothetical protein
MNAGIEQKKRARRVSVLLELGNSVRFIATREKITVRGNIINER